MSDRMRRVNEAVRQVVAEAVGELKDPRIGLVTVTGVSVSRDLREGKVFVAVHGNEKKQASTLAGLESAHAYLQAKVARQLSLKRTPLLTFEYDQTVERGMRMTSLIDELTPGGPADEAPGDEAPNADGDRDGV
jgi:ribosome-binding factor A